MSGKAILLYVTSDTAEKIRELSSSAARPDWEKWIRVYVADRSEQSRDRPSANRPSSNLEQRISQDWHQIDSGRVFVEKSLGVNDKKLAREGVKIRSCSSATINSELRGELMRMRLHWLSHSEFEWRKSGIQHLHPQEWIRQFSLLGLGWIGEGLLKQLRVISDAELRDGWCLSTVDVLGLSVAHGCVRDDEPGSSSMNVQDLLEHTYASGVLKIDFNQQPAEVSALDHLYVYEDGLWSGVELVKRLELLAKWPAIQSRDLKVSFRFGATSDAGIYAARHFLRRERLTSVDISVGGVSHLEVLRDGAIALLSAQREASDDDVRRSLDAHVEPDAFRLDAIWQGRAAEALESCRIIGEQLVRPWLVRTKGPEVADERMARWALGAFGFSTLTAFSKSVPKPALPLIWLNGAVEVGGRCVEWRPLFWDSRRTGASPPSRRILN